MRYLRSAAILPVALVLAIAASGCAALHIGRGHAITDFGAPTNLPDDAAPLGHFFRGEMALAQNDVNPAHLRADILAALPQMHPRRPVMRAWAGQAWRYAAVLAGVLLTGALVFRLMDFGSAPARDEMSGTLAAPRGGRSRR